MSRNTNLSAAKNAKNDEFYTQYADIQKEVNAYLDIEDLKWEYLEGDGDFRSEEVKRLRDEADVIVTNPPFSLFREFLAWILEGEKEGNEGVSFDRINRIDRIGNAGDGGRGDRESVEKEGDGFNAKGAKGFDAKNAKSAAGSHGASGTPRPTGDIGRARRPDAPPKKFLIIGNMNALKYKEAFPLIQADRMWLGATGFSSDMVFAVPKGTAVPAAYREKAARLGYVGDYTRLGNSCWYTNIDHGRRHQPLALMAEKDNVKYSKHKEIRGAGYQHYLNYDAIEVPYTDAIPSDYGGVMGVPISFLDKYCPEQFEILGMCENEDLYGLKTRVFSSAECKAAYRAKFGKPGTYDLNCSCVLNVNGILDPTYHRLFIRRRNP